MRLWWVAALAAIMASPVRESSRDIAKNHYVDRVHWVKNVTSGANQPQTNTSHDGDLKNNATSAVESTLSIQETIAGQALVGHQQDKTKAQLPEHVSDRIRLNNNQMHGAESQFFDPSWGFDDPSMGTHSDGNPDLEAGIFDDPSFGAHSNRDPTNIFGDPTHSDGYFNSETNIFGNPQGNNDPNLDADITGRSKEAAVTGSNDRPSLLLDHIDTVINRIRQIRAHNANSDSNQVNEGDSAWSRDANLDTGAATGHPGGEINSLATDVNDDPSPATDIQGDASVGLPMVESGTAGDGTAGGKIRGLLRDLIGRVRDRVNSSGNNEEPRQSAPEPWPPYPSHPPPQPSPVYADLEPLPSAEPPNWPSYSSYPSPSPYPSSRPSMSPWPSNTPVPSVSPSPEPSPFQLDVNDFIPEDNDSTRSERRLMSSSSAGDWGLLTSTSSAATGKWNDEKAPSDNSAKSQASSESSEGKSFGTSEKLSAPSEGTSSDSLGESSMTNSRFMFAGSGDDSASTTNPAYSEDYGTDGKGKSSYSSQGISSLSSGISQTYYVLKEGREE